MTAPELRNNSPRWTEWGWPPRTPTVRHGWAGGLVSTCCRRTPGELPATDRLVTDPELVTCEPGPLEELARIECMAAHPSARAL